MSSDSRSPDEYSSSTNARSRSACGVSPRALSIISAASSTESAFGNVLARRGARTAATGLQLIGWCDASDERKLRQTDKRGAMERGEEPCAGLRMRPQQI